MLTIIPGDDYFCEVLVASTLDPESAFTPATAVSGVKVILSDTDGGAAIASALSVACTDTSATKTVSGQVYQIYTGTLLGADTLTALASYPVGSIIYQRTEIGAHARASVPVRIVSR